MAALKLSAVYIKCRTLRHAWDDFIPRDMPAPQWGHRVSLRCLRCTTERHDVIDRLGQLSQRTYIYPTDYALTADETPDIQQLRLMLIKSLNGGRRGR